MDDAEIEAATSRSVRIIVRIRWSRGIKHGHYSYWYEYAYDIVRPRISIASELEIKSSGRHAQVYCFVIIISYPEAITGYIHHIGMLTDDDGSQQSFNNGKHGMMNHE